MTVPAFKQISAVGVSNEAVCFGLDKKGVVWVRAQESGWKWVSLTKASELGG